MQRKRYLERRETLAYWPAADTAKGETVGLVTDLTEKGIRIHSKHGFLKGEVLTIRIAVDAQLAGADHILLTIENVWCRASGLPDLYHGGFKIVKISDKAKAGIRNLLQAFSYPAPSEGRKPE